MSVLDVFAVVLGYGLGALLVVSVGVIVSRVASRRYNRPASALPKPAGWDDRAYAAAHGIPLDKWVTLTPEQQAHLRDTVAHTYRNAA